MRTKKIVAGIIRSWWVVAFMLGCLIIYEQSLKNRETQRAVLRQQWEQLQQDRLEEMALQKDLEVQINSQSDPAWIELTLMKGLGVVPEDQTKVYFE